MRSEYWRQRWENNEIGFHERDVNPMLVGYIDRLKLKRNDRIFVPLCGKTSALAWLLSQGYRVVGVECSELAVRQLFEELDITPAIKLTHHFIHYSNGDLEVFVGNFFSLTANLLGPVAAIYDRAALIALSKNLRATYAEHLPYLTQNAPLLLNIYQFDQKLMDGPPFSVSESELAELFGEHYEWTLLAAKSVEKKLKNICRPIEELRLLVART